jgi:hypothetical protein
LALCAMLAWLVSIELIDLPFSHLWHAAVKQTLAVERTRTVKVTMVAERTLAAERTRRDGLVR